MSKGEPITLLRTSQRAGCAGRYMKQHNTTAAVLVCHGARHHRHTVNVWRDVLPAKEEVSTLLCYYRAPSFNPTLGPETPFPKPKREEFVPGTAWEEERSWCQIRGPQNLYDHQKQHETPSRGARGEEAWISRCQSPFWGRATRPRRSRCRVRHRARAGRRSKVVHL